MFCGVLFFAGAFLNEATAEELTGHLSNTYNLDTSKPLSISDCIKTALVQSPYMAIENLSIDIKRLDADDEWSRMFPKINLYLAENLPAGGKNNRGPSTAIALTSGHYDPITSYLKHDAALVAIKLAKYAKLQTAENIIQSVLEVFIRQEAFEQNIACDARLEDLASEQQAFVEKMYANAPTTPLEVRFAEFERKQIDLNNLRLKNRNTKMLLRMKRLLGIPIYQKIDLIAENMEQNIFNNFNPYNLSYEQILASSLFEKMVQARNELAEAGVKVAWGAYVPKFSLQVRAPDPVNDSTDDDSYYFTLGMTVPIAHWGERGRTHEKAVLNKNRTMFSNQSEMLQKEDEWYSSRAALEEMQEDLKLAELNVEIQRTLVKKAKILFNAGQTNYGDLIKEKINFVKAQKRVIQLKERYLITKLALFKFSGALMNTYIKVENENDAK